MNEAIPLLPVYAFMAWTAKTLPFNLLLTLPEHNHSEDPILATAQRDLLEWNV
jgi:hypothetical protein